MGLLGNTMSFLLDRVFTFYLIADTIKIYVATQSPLTCTVLFSEVQPLIWSPAHRQPPAKTVISVKPEQWQSIISSLLWTLQEIHRLKQKNINEKCTMRHNCTKGKRLFNKSVNDTFNFLWIRHIFALYVKIVRSCSRVVTFSKLKKLVRWETTFLLGKG